MLVGTLDAVRRYPVKSLRGERLDCAQIAATGLPGDRGSALFVRAGSARVGKPYRGKEHERLHLMQDEASALAAAAERGVDADVRRGDHFFDDAPISVIVDRWLEKLSEDVGYCVEWERFRPNLFVRAVPGFTLGESAIVNAELHVGTASLIVRCPIERCVTVTYHPHGEPSDPGILRYLAQHRNAMLGIYCDVLEAGSVRVGDAVDARGVA